MISIESLTSATIVEQEDEPIDVENMDEEELKRKLNIKDEDAE